MMNRNQVISIRLTTEEKQRLEQAAAVSGFESLGTYIREKVLPDNHRDAASSDSMATVDALTPLLFDLQREQANQGGLLAILLALTVRKSTSGDLRGVEVELARAQELGLSPEKLAALLVPDWQQHLSVLMDR